MTMRAGSLRFWTRLKPRLTPFGDLGAWVLLIVSAVPLYFIDPAMLVTLGQWTLYGLNLAGIAIVLCRLMVPQLDLTVWLKKAAEGSGPAALVVFGVFFLLSTLFIGLVLWAKA